jgi:hypothetical protein
MTWVGWLRRPGGRWVRLASGPTLDDCHKALLAEARRLGLGSATRIMTGGHYPPISGRDGGADPHPRGKTP